MAKVENLISEVADTRLREEIAREVAAFKKQKKFGLVFEEHLPEVVHLHGLTVKAGARVVLWDRGSKETFTVEEIYGSGQREPYVNIFI